MRLLLLSLSLLPLFIHAQIDPRIEWQNRFGLDDGGVGVPDLSWDLTKTSDGGYAIIGNTYSSAGPGGHTDLFFVKTDALGSSINPGSFVATYGSPSNEAGYDVIQTTDGGYAILGHSTQVGGDVSNNHGGSDYWFIKTDASGVISWEKSYGSTMSDNGRDVIQTNDGGYLMIGESSGSDGDVTHNQGNFDFWVLKINSTGDTLWQKSYGGTEYEIAQSVIQTADGGYIIAGETRSDDGDVLLNQGQSDFWVIKISSTGALLWEQTYGGSSYEYMEEMIQTTGGDYVLVGSSSSSDGDVGNNKGDKDVWVVMIDNTGTMLWSKNYGGIQSDWAYSVVENVDGSLIIGGETESTAGDINDDNLGFDDHWILRVEASNGNIIESKTLGGSDNDELTRLVMSDDSALVVLGTTGSSDGDLEFPGDGSSDYWLYKLSICSPGIELITSSTNETGENLDDGTIAMNLFDGTDGASFWLLQGNDTVVGISTINLSDSFTDVEPGYYTVIGIDDFGCQAEDEVEIIAYTPDTLNCGNAVPLNCQETYQGASSTAISLVTYYGCNNWDETGPERVHSFTPNANGPFTAQISNFTGDLDVYILNSCDPSDCVGLIDSDSAYLAQADSGHTYYIVVDSDNGSGSAYDIVVTGCEVDSTPDLCEGFGFTFVVENETDTSASDGSVQVNASGTSPFSYFWTDNDTTANLDSLVSGWYSVLVTDSNGCWAEDSAFVGLDTGFVCDTIVLQLFSNNQTDSATINGEVGVELIDGGDAPYAHLWSTGDTTSYVDSLAAGTYTVLVTDSNGCMGTDSVTIGVDTLDLCIGFTLGFNLQNETMGMQNGMLGANVNGGTLPYNYQWSTSDTTVSIDSLAAGSYSLIVTDSNGCMLTDTATIINDTTEHTDCSGFSLSIISSDETATSANDGTANAIALGGTAPYSYQWSNAEVSAQIANLSPGTYTITANDINGCEIIDTIQIYASGQNPCNIDVSVNVTDETQLGASDGGIMVSASGGTAPYTYQWSNNMTADSLGGLSSGTYVVTVTDSLGCTSISVGVVSVKVGIVDMKQQAGLSLYPNPVFNLIQLQFPSDYSDHVIGSISIYAPNGKQVYQQSKIDLRKPINALDLASGHYIANIVVNEQAISIPFIVSTTNR